jgi:hypothetical protein
VLRQTSNDYDQDVLTDYVGAVEAINAGPSTRGDGDELLSDTDEHFLVGDYPFGQRFESGMFLHSTFNQRKDVFWLSKLFPAKAGNHRLKSEIPIEMLVGWIPVSRTTSTCVLNQLFRIGSSIGSDALLGQIRPDSTVDIC